jgi:hypothetical protein
VNLRILAISGGGENKGSVHSDLTWNPDASIEPGRRKRLSLVPAGAITSFAAVISFVDRRMSQQKTDNRSVLGTGIAVAAL